MSSFPNEPVSPREFIEEVIPALFADLDFDMGNARDESGDSLDFKVGVDLRGESGGQWTLHFIDGELGIANEIAADCNLIVLQSVADWRAGLWEGRPGLVSDVVARLKKTGPLDPTAGHPGEMGNPVAFRELENLPGRIDAIVEGDGQADWAIGVLIGPGPIPDVAQASIRIGSREAESIRRGELHPIEALISGQLRLEGDLGLILQLQAIAMAASLPRPPAP